MIFAMTIPEQTKPALWGAVGGAIALAFAGFTFGGWVTGGTATELARRQADNAVVAALTPFCVEKFRHAANANENLGRLKAISFSWERGTYVSKGGWATLPGHDEPNSGVAQACAELLSNQ
jgi:hypothetical protein